MENKKKIMSDMVASTRRKKLEPSEKKEIVTAIAKHEPVRDTIIQQPESPQIGCSLVLLLPVCIIAITLVVGGLFSGARVVATPKQWKGNIDVSTTLVLGASQDSKNIPFFTATKKVTKSVTVPAAFTAAKETYAEGTVRFYNTTKKAQTIPSGSKMTLAKIEGTDSVSQIIYTTQTAIKVPTGTEKQPGQKDVVIRAVNPGSASNAEPTDFSLLKEIPGIVIRSVTAISGGATALDRAPAPEVLLETQAVLKESFDADAVLIRRVVEEIPDSMTPLPVSFVSQQPQFDIRASGDNAVEVVATKDVVITFARKTDLARLLSPQLGVPSEQVVTLNDLSGLTVTTTALGSAENIPKILPIRATGEITVFGKSDAAEIINKIKGKSKKEAKQDMVKMQAFETITIHSTPFWRRILPLDAEKISVTILNP